MSEQQIKEMLDQLAEVQAQIDAVRVQEQEAIDSVVLPPEIQQQFDDIRDEFAGKSEAAEEKAKELDKQIKDAIVEYGVTVKGNILMGVFNKGRVKFDTKRAQAYLKSQGVYDEYCSEGKPYASIRKV